MYPTSRRTRGILAAAGAIAILCVAAIALLAPTTPVGSAPARTVVPTLQPGGAARPAGTVLPSVVAAVDPRVANARPFDPKANFPGAPAIKPSVASTDALTPAFGEPEVRAYLGANPPLGARVSAAGPTTVKSVTFATNADTRRQRGHAPDTADARLICTVELAGSFTVTGPPGTKASTRPVAILFFDANTGNLLEVNVP